MATVGQWDHGCGLEIEPQTNATVNHGVWLRGDGYGSCMNWGAGSGDDSDATMWYDGNDLCIDPATTGSGGLRVLSMKSGATAAAAGAATDELWKTNGHATLPNNVVMIG